MKMRLRKLLMGILLGVVAGSLISDCWAGGGDEVANGTEYTRHAQYVTWSD